MVYRCAHCGVPLMESYRDVKTTVMLREVGGDYYKCYECERELKSVKDFVRTNDGEIDIKKRNWYNINWRMENYE